MEHSMFIVCRKTRTSAYDCKYQHTIKVLLYIVYVNVSLRILLKMIRFNRLKIYDNTFKKSLRRKCWEVIFITIKICSASYIICCCRIGTSLRGGNEFGTRPFWYPFRGVF